MEKLLEEKVNSVSSPDQTVGESVAHQATTSRSMLDHKHDSQQLLIGSKTRSFVKQSSQVLPQVVKDSDSKPSMVSVPVESEEDAMQVKFLSRRIPKTKGWAPNLTTKPTVHKKVCINFGIFFNS